MNRDCGPHCTPDTCKVKAQEKFMRDFDERDSTKGAFRDLPGPKPSVHYSALEQADMARKEREPMCCGTCRHCEWPVEIVLNRTGICTERDESVHPTDYCQQWEAAEF